MARPVLADIEALNVALDTPVTNEAQALSLLHRASAIVRAYAGQTWLDDDGNLEGVPDDVPGVVVSMVERATRNPDGGVSNQETVGPFAWSRSFGDDAAQRLYLTAMDKLVLGSAIGASPLGIITTTRGPLETPSVSDYWDLPEGVIW